MKSSVTVCQLYSDIMSTYGDRGNVLYLEYFLKQHGLTVDLLMHRYGQIIPQADIYVFGGGQDEMQTLVATDLQGKNGQRLSQYLKESYCLAICGGYQLLGKYYMQKDGKNLPGLNHLPVITVASDQRQVGPIIIKRRFNKHQRTVIGFENHSGKTYILDGSSPLGSVLKGGGNNSLDSSEGIVFGKTIGTYLHGPVLPRNPHLAYWWLNEILPRTDEKLSLVTERLAHRAYLQEIGWSS